jgi:hypothetical protein
MKVCFRIFYRIDKAFVLMTPDNQIEEFWKEIFREKACFGVGVAMQWLIMAKCERRGNVLILVYAHQVEPLVFLRTRLEELDFSISKRSKQSFVTDVTQTIQSEFGPAFLKKHWLDFDSVRLWSPAIVVK